MKWHAIVLDALWTSQGGDSIFLKEVTIYKPRHTEEEPLSLFWKQKIDVEATSKSTSGGGMWVPSEYTPLWCVGFLLQKDHNSPLKSPVLAAPFAREGGVISEGTKGYVSS